MNTYRSVVKDTIEIILTNYEKAESWCRISEKALLDYIDRARSAKLITEKEAIDFCIRAGAI